MSTFESGDHFAAGVGHSKYPRVQSGLCIDDGAGLRSSRDGPHSTTVAGKTLHVLASLVHRAQPVATAVHQRGVVDEVDRRAIAAY